MVLIKTEPSDGKPRYLVRDGDMIFLRKEKRGHLLDEVPPGWELKIVDGHWRLKRIRKNN